MTSWDGAIVHPDDLLALAYVLAKALGIKVDAAESSDATRRWHTWPMGAITPDGCSVELYARLPGNGEPELVSRAVPAGCGILDLGCGAGRLGNPLAALGHRVVGVDESPEMLAHLSGVEPVCSRIEELRLAEQFDAVLLASNLINTPDERQRAQLLESCRRHLRPHGTLVAQWHPPEWFDALHVGSVREGSLGPVTVRLDVLNKADDLLTAECAYRMDEQGWTHRFVARRLTEQQLTASLLAAGLELRTWLDDGRHWFTASR